MESSCSDDVAMEAKVRSVTKGHFSPMFLSALKTLFMISNLGLTSDSYRAQPDSVYG